VITDKEIGERVTPGRGQKDVQRRNGVFTFVENTTEHEKTGKMSGDQERSAKGSGGGCLKEARRYCLNPPRNKGKEGTIQREVKKGSEGGRMLI